jgi:hypothetical protein
MTLTKAFKHDNPEKYPVYVSLQQQFFSLKTVRQNKCADVLTKNSKPPLQQG